MPVAIGVLFVIQVSDTIRIRSEVDVEILDYAVRDTRLGFLFV